MAPRADLTFENVYNFVFYFVILFAITISVAFASFTLNKALVAGINSTQSFIYIAVGLALNLLAWVILLIALSRFVQPKWSSMMGYALRPMQRAGGAVGLFIAFGALAAGSALLIVSSVDLATPAVNADIYNYGLISGIIGIVAAFFLIFHAIYAGRLSMTKSVSY